MLVDFATPFDKEDSELIVLDLLQDMMEQIETHEIGHLNVNNQEDNISFYQPAPNFAADPSSSNVVEIIEVIDSSAINYGEVDADIDFLAEELPFNKTELIDVDDEIGNDNESSFSF